MLPPLLLQFDRLALQTETKTLERFLGPEEWKAMYDAKERARRATIQKNLAIAEERSRAEKRKTLQGWSLTKDSESLIEEAGALLKAALFTKKRVHSLDQYRRFKEASKKYAAEMMYITNRPLSDENRAAWSTSLAAYKTFCTAVAGQMNMIILGMEKSVRDHLYHEKEKYLGEIVAFLTEWLAEAEEWIGSDEVAKFDLAEGMPRAYYDEIIEAQERLKTLKLLVQDMPSSPPMRTAWYYDFDQLDSPRFLDMFKEGTMSRTDKMKEIRSVLNHNFGNPDMANHAMGYREFDMGYRDIMGELNGQYLNQVEGYIKRQMAVMLRYIKENNVQKGSTVSCRVDFSRFLLGIFTITYSLYKGPYDVEVVPKLQIYWREEGNQNTVNMRMALYEADRTRRIEREKRNITSHSPYVVPPMNGRNIASRLDLRRWLLYMKDHVRPWADWKKKAKEAHIALLYGNRLGSLWSQRQIVHGPIIVTDTTADL